MILKKELLERLSKQLSLPFTGFEQDWAIEMADSSKIDSFLTFYYQKKLTSDEKVGVMSLILASYEDFLNENNIKVDSRWYRIKSILESDKITFMELINYWSLNDDPDDWFKITNLLREI